MSEMKSRTTRSPRVSAVPVADPSFKQAGATRIARMETHHEANVEKFDDRQNQLAGLQRY